MVFVNDNFIVPELIVEVYKFMISMQVRIELENDSVNSGFREGQQDGFIMCWSTLFGSSSDDDAEAAHIDQTSLYDIIGLIMFDVKKKIDLSQYVNYDIEQWEKLQEQLNIIVESYVKSNYSACYSAIRKI